MSNIKYATTYNWCAPFELWAVLNNEFKFTLDPFKSFDVTDEEMLLSKAWDEKEVVFCCPPYGKSISLWVGKCYQHGKNGGLAVMLLPARTDTAWFHNFIYNQENVEIRFLRGRLKFGNAQ